MLRLRQSQLGDWLPMKYAATRVITYAYSILQYTDRLLSNLRALIV